MHKCFLARKLDLIFLLLIQSLSFKKILPRFFSDPQSICNLQCHSHYHFIKVKNFGSQLQCLLTSILIEFAGFIWKIMYDSNSISQPDIKLKNCRVDFTHTKHNAKPERNQPCLITAYF